MERIEDSTTQNGSRYSDGHLERKYQRHSNGCSTNDGERHTCSDMSFQRTCDHWYSKKKRHHYDETSSSRYDIKRRKKVRKGKKNDVHSLSDAIRTCVPSLIKDVTFNEVEDKAIENGCLTDDECRIIKDITDRKKQIRKVVIITTKRSFETMSNFLDALKPVYPHLSEHIWYQYERNLMERPKRLVSRRLCPLCCLKDCVDVEKVIDDLYSEKIIDDRLYARINSNRKEVGQQDKLWDAVLKACVKNHGIELLFCSLESNEHYSHITKRLRYFFRNNRNMKQFCTCSKYTLDKKIQKLRTLSLDSETSHSPRETSDSVSSIGSDIKSESETDTIPPADDIVTVTPCSNDSTFSYQGQAMITESIEVYDPLLNCNKSICDTISEMTPEENLNQGSSEQKESEQVQTVAKEPPVRHIHAYELSLPIPYRQRNQISDRHQATGRPRNQVHHRNQESERSRNQFPKGHQSVSSGSFRSVVSRAMLQLRVLRQFMKKDNTKVPMESNKPSVSEDMCETVL